MNQKPLDDLSEGERAAPATTDVAVPPAVRLALVHAYMQHVADACGADVLHIKGAAIDPVLSGEPRGSMDVDILVRPAHLDRLLAEMRRRGWQRVTGFEEGSAFGHAMNLSHSLGMVDLHRKWPGFEVSPERAFDELWTQRTTLSIAGMPCTVPSVSAQRLILLLHYGRSGGQRSDDLRRGWTEADEATRAEVVGLAQRFAADLALAAATGDLDSFRSDPAYRLWRYFSDGTGGRFEEWWGRWHAAQRPIDKARVIKGFLLVNDDLLRSQLEHEPTMSDYCRAYRVRMTHALHDLGNLAGRRGRKGSRVPGESEKESS